MLMNTDAKDTDADAARIWEEAKALRAGRDNPAPASPMAETSDEPDDEPELVPIKDGKPAPDQDGSDDDPDESPADDDPKAKSDPKPAPDLAKLKEQNERLEQQLRSERGRRSADRRLIETLQSRQDKVETPASDGDAQRKRREKLQRAREDYPDLAGPMAEEFEELRRRDEQQDAAQARAREVDQRQLKELYAEQLTVFEEEHPDGFEIIRANEAAFKEWVEDQNKTVRDVFQANAQHIVDGPAAAYVVGLFKAAIAEAVSPSDPISDHRRRQLAGARSSSSRNTPRTSARPAKDSTDTDALWADAKRERAKMGRR